MHCHVEAIEKPVDQTALRTSAAAVLRITGMGCPNCATRVRNSLLQVPGVLAAGVELDARLARVNFDDRRTGLADLLHAVARAGAGSHHSYSATLVSATWQPIR